MRLAVRVLGSLGQHHPTYNLSALRNLHWTPANAQLILDVALAWACVNRQFEIAAFLLERGANINTDWSTQEPASILHECAISGNYEAAQFLIDHGIDMNIRDHRWNATAEGWAYHAARDKNMAEFLARAERTERAVPLKRARSWRSSSDCIRFRDFVLTGCPSWMGLAVFAVTLSWKDVCLGSS